MGRMGALFEGLEIPALRQALAAAPARPFHNIRSSFEEVPKEFPTDLNQSIGAYRISDALVKPAYKGQYTRSGYLRDLLGQMPELDNAGVRGEMEGRPYGSIIIRPDMEGRGRPAIDALMRHEYRHAKRNFENPRFADAMYTDTLVGKNPYFEKVLAESGLPSDDVTRYYLHPEEFDARMAADNDQPSLFAPQRPGSRWNLLNTDLPSFQRRVEGSYDSYLQDLMKQQQLDASLLRDRNAEADALRATFKGYTP